MRREPDQLAFLGEEFLTWLWFTLETDGGEVELSDELTIGVSFDDFIAFAPRAEDETEHTLRKGLPTRCAEARAALRNGRRLRLARLVIAEGERQWSVVIDGATLDLRSVRLPNDPEDASSNEERAIARIDAFARVDELVRGLYARFLRDRLRPEYLRTRAPAQGRWMAGA